MLLKYGSVTSWLLLKFHICQKCRVTETEVHRALLSGDPQDQLVIAYNLVIDNKRIADESKFVYSSSHLIRTPLLPNNSVLIKCVLEMYTSVRGSTTCINVAWCQDIVSFLEGCTSVESFL